MEQQNRVRATSPVRYLVCAALIVFLLVAYSLKWIPRTWESLLATTVCAVVVFPAAVWNLIHIKYLTPEGVESCRFGRVVHTVSWKQTAQVCIARESKNSSISLLLIVPAGCERYNSKNWSGRSFAFRFRKQAVTVDNTEKNRTFIETYYGEIADMRNS